uniref:Uncharacterized protein n=1 Tax=Pipistrellus kuhlii TaxID=59472 RepID=A0A7J8A8A6_PIPKU|nr:hypothetical protein mPipKuh1_008854 [Pipistrellus kuhlii]
MQAPSGQGQVVLHDPSCSGPLGSMGRWKGGSGQSEGSAGIQGKEGPFLYESLYIGLLVFMIKNESIIKDVYLKYETIVSKTPQPELGKRVQVEGDVGASLEWEVPPLFHFHPSYSHSRACCPFFAPSPLP